MDALKRYRTGGEQKVTVQHVTVTEGGQAIVGNVTQPAARSTKNRTKSSPNGKSSPKGQTAAPMASLAPDGESPTILTPAMTTAAAAGSAKPAPVAVTRKQRSAK